MSNNLLDMVTLIGRVYVVPSEVKNCPDIYLCIDAKEKSGLVLKVFSKEDIEYANSLARALNEWAGKQ